MKKEIKISLAITSIVFGGVGWYLFFSMMEVSRQCEAGVRQFGQGDIRTMCIAGIFIGASVLISAFNQLIQDKE